VPTPNPEIYRSETPGCRAKLCYRAQPARLALKRSSSANRQRKGHNQNAQVDPHRDVAVVQRQAVTLLSARTHSESAFTHEEISSDQWVSNPRLVTNHRDHFSVPRR
jgi:hypothetical protein